MDIAIFTHDFAFKFPFELDLDEEVTWGGVGEVVYNLAFAFSKYYSNDNLTIFTVSNNNKTKYITYKNVTIYAFARGKIKIGNTHLSIKFILSPLLYKKFDVIHIQRGVDTASLAGYIYSFFKRVAYCVTYHEDVFGVGGSLFRNWTVLFLNKLLVNTLLKNASKITTLTYEYLNSSSYLKKFKNKVTIIPNGVNVERSVIGEDDKLTLRDKLSLPQNGKIVLFVGSLTYRKGVCNLIESMNNVINNVPEAYLILVGDGDLKNKLQQKTKEMEIKDNVKFEGFISEHKKQKLFMASDIFVLPSLSEGFGIVLLEALSFGLPIIASDLNVFKTILINDYNGLYFPTKDSKKLAEKISYLLCQNETRKKMSQNAIEHVRKFDWRQISKQYREVYETIFNNTNKQF